MSSTSSSPRGESLPSSRCGERPPLRTLENGNQQMSTSSPRLKSKLNTEGDVSVCYPQPALHPPPSTYLTLPSIDVISCGQGDVTFKSFICSGGEIEILSSSVCAGESIVLPKDQNTSNTCETEDTIIPHCMILPSVIAEHKDHPYCQPVLKDASSSDISEAPSAGDVVGVCAAEDDKRLDSDCTMENNVTWKTLVCDGGEVEVSEFTRVLDETIPLPKGEFVQDPSFNSSSMLNSFQLLPEEHADHPYCSTENGFVAVTSNLPLNSVDSEKHVDGLTDVTMKPFKSTGSEISTEISDGIKVAGDTVPVAALQTAMKTDSFSHCTVSSTLPGDHDVGLPTLPRITQECSRDGMDEMVANGMDGPRSSQPTGCDVMEKGQICHLMDNSKQDELICDQPDSSVEHNEASHPPAVSVSSPTAPDVSTSVLHKTRSSDCNDLVSSAKTSTPEQVQQQSDSLVQCSSEEKDSALGSSENGRALSNSADKPLVETLPDVLRVLSECTSALQLGILSPVVRRTPPSLQKDPLYHFLAADSALEGEEGLAPSPVNCTGLWAEPLERPMPRPLFNSTAVDYKPQLLPAGERAEDLDTKPCAVLQSEAEKSILENPLIADGPLQQQLRQMAEFLLLASGKMGPGAAPAGPSARAAAVEFHSVCVGTSPLTRFDRSLNTSGQFERKRQFSVTDACTLTDPLLWNVPPGSLECLTKQELEQRLRSSMIMVEALVQQLAVARAHGSPAVGTLPSELRDKLVQTDHTELSQTTMYKDLYMVALNRIGDMERDTSSLHSLVQSMQDMQVTMTSLSSDTDVVLSNMKQMEEVVREDHQSLVSHYGEMKSLFEKSKEMQTRMMQKVKDALQQRDDMRTQMEDAFRAKEAAFSAMEQLRKHCATELSELQQCVGLQQDLLAALKMTYPQQVALNKASNEILTSASDLLFQTTEEQSTLMKDLTTVKSLLHKAAPLLLKLKEKAEDALKERDEQILARNQAVEEREQIEEELNQAKLSLQTASEQIGDLNLHATILTSEVGVLRQKLSEREDERAQLEMKVTEMSATVSSTVASHTFLEHTLAAETTKLLEAQEDVRQASDRADKLESALCQSQQQLCELTEALAESEEQLSQLQTLSQSQGVKLQQLQNDYRQLADVREMNEFLQMENELAREQISESQNMLSANLQALRERNIHCEDLSGELGHLQLEHRSLQEELESLKVRASETQLELREKLAQAVTEITLLHHTLRGVTNELLAALSDEGPRMDATSQPGLSTEHRNPSSSLDNIVVGLPAEDAVHTETPAGPDVGESQGEFLFSETSAFTRIAPIPKKDFSAQELEEEESSVPELVADLGGTVDQLVTTLTLLQQHKNSQLEGLRHTICSLEAEQASANNRHEVEVCELKHQLGVLNSLLEKGHQDLQKEVVELRHSLQQSQAESQFLRTELKNACDQSANPAYLMEEKIQLLKKVQLLKENLQEAEQARAKLLDRAKRHQIIHQTNQQKSENELLILNEMINKVRETLLSLPTVVKNCDQLQQLVEYIG